METVFAEWLEKGLADPFEGRYNGVVDDLPFGNVPSTALSLMLVPMASKLGGIMYLTAAKERVRWLSKRLYDLSTDHKGINQRRSELPKGDVNDYELANQFFMTEDKEDLLAGMARIDFLLDELKALGDKPF
tara:strand:+ start:3826 stop:4221 length:396 start_codon:yes stop_codon:yes gene_type:complete